MSCKASLSDGSARDDLDDFFDHAWADSANVDDLFRCVVDHSVVVAKSEDRSRSPHRIAPDMRTFQGQAADGDHVPMVPCCSELHGRESSGVAVAVRKKSHPAIGTLAAAMPAVPSLTPHRDNLQRRCQAMWSRWSSQKREIVKSLRILKLLSCEEIPFRWWGHCRGARHMHRSQALIGG